MDIPSDYEPVNEIEQAVFQKRDWLINGESMLSQAMADVTQGITESRHAAGLEVEALRSQVSALSEILGLALPDVTWDAIAAEVRDGKFRSYKEVIDKHYKPVVAKAVAEHAKKKARDAQARSPRPPKADSVSARLSTMDPNMTYAEMARQMGIV